MTHTNLRRAVERRKLRDWLEVLNWRGKKASDTLLASLEGIGESQHVEYARFDSQDSARLRLFVKSWIDADRDLLKIHLRLPRQEAELLRHHLARPVKAFLGIDETGRIVPVRFYDTLDRPFHLAVAYFVRIANSRERWRLCGPCPDCRRYFLRKSHRDKKRCSRCRRKESGPRMRTMRDRTKDDRLKLAREGIKEYSKHPRRNDWKPWVARYVNQKSDYSPIQAKSLTRWLNSGLIDDSVLTGNARDKI